MHSSFEHNKFFCASYARAYGALQCKIGRWNCNGGGKHHMHTHTPMHNQLTINRVYCLQASAAPPPPPGGDGSFDPYNPGNAPPPPPSTRSIGYTIYKREVIKFEVVVETRTHTHMHPLPPPF